LFAEFIGGDSIKLPVTFDRYGFSRTRSRCLTDMLNLNGQLLNESLSGWNIFAGLAVSKHQEMPWDV